MNGVLAEAVVYLDPVEAYGNDSANLFHNLSVRVPNAQLVEGVNCHGHVDRVVIDAKSSQRLSLRT